jgi:MazG family protein
MSPSDVRPLAGPRPPETPPATGEPRLDAVARLIAIVDRLRDPDGCPWDLSQTLVSVVPHLVEEAHELVEAVESGDDGHAVEEAGDLLMGIALLARIAEQEGRFDLARVAGAVSDKLVRRHPHVFGDVTASSADEALASWESIKRREREEREVDESALAGIPVALPALQRAERTGEKAIAAGFKWSSPEGALDKLREEVAELAREMEGPADPARLEHELGDVLLAAAFVGNYLKLDPEKATREALRRFERRFRDMEEQVGGPLEGKSLARLLEAWARAKQGQG